MAIKYFFPATLISFYILVLSSCQEKPKEGRTNFTKVDSLTDTYLALQDSMLQIWNIMINDDNQKIDAMGNLIHELKVSNATDQETIRSYEERLAQLKESRYTQ